MAAGYGISLVGGVVSLALYARVLGPVDYGVLAVDLALIEALQAVAFQWHRLAVVKFWAANESTGLASYLHTHHLTWLVLAGVLACGFLVFQLAGPRPPGVSWLLVMATGVAKSAALYAQELARVTGAILRYAAGASCLTLGTSVAGVAAYEATQSIEAVLLASIAVFVVSSLIGAGGIVMASRRARFGWQHLHAMLRYGLPLIPVFVATTALTRLDRPILAQFETSEVVGAYAAASTLIASVVGAVCMLVVTPAFPWLLREKALRDNAAYLRLHAQVGTLMLGGVLAVAIALYCARASIFPLLLGHEIGDAAQAHLLPLLAIAIVGAFRAHCFDQAYHLFSRTHSLMLINLMTLAVATVALYAGARNGGVAGMVQGLLLASMASLAASMVFARTFVDWREMGRGIVRLVPVAGLAMLAAGLVSGLVEPVAGDGHARGLMLAAVALATFGVAMLAVNAGGIRSFARGCS